MVTRALGAVLASNRSLKRLELFGDSGMSGEDVTALARGLFRNRSLVILGLHYGVEDEGAAALAWALHGNDVLQVGRGCRGVTGHAGGAGVQGLKLGGWGMRVHGGRVVWAVSVLRAGLAVYGLLVY